MTAARPKRIAPDAGDRGSSELFDDLADLTEHEIAALIGSKRPPKLPPRHVHPVMAQFPSISGVAFENLVADIRVNGQKKAVAMYQGYVWDGRARYDACVSLGLVPKIWALHRGSPIIYLIQRHDPSRYGGPNSKERDEALTKLSRIQETAWKTQAAKNCAEWIAFARHEFKDKYRYPRPCAVCGLSEGYSHAHHSLPLNLQYDLGVDEPLHDHDWLCPVHHKQLHRMIASLMTGATRRHDDFTREARWRSPKDQKLMSAAFAVFDRGMKLYAGIGGVSAHGNWRMLTP